jgi:predicted HicB family RNase H-like nuclease
MKSVIQECHCTVGPYEGYVGRAEYDGDAGVFHGAVLGTRDVITFQGKDMASVATAFQESVDDYLNFCRARGESPDKPFSGQFVTRISPTAHRAISALAQAQGKSLNQFVRDALEEVVGRENAGRKPKRPPPKHKSKSAK